MKKIANTVLKYGMLAGFVADDILRKLKGNRK